MSILSKTLLPWGHTGIDHHWPTPGHFQGIVPGRKHTPACYIRLLTKGFSVLEVQWGILRGLRLTDLWKQPPPLGALGRPLGDPLGWSLFQGDALLQPETPLVVCSTRGCGGPRNGDRGASALRRVVTESKRTSSGPRCRIVCVFTAFHVEGIMSTFFHCISC